MVPALAKCKYRAEKGTTGTTHGSPFAGGPLLLVVAPTLHTRVTRKVNDTKTNCVESTDPVSHVEYDHSETNAGKTD